MQRLLLLFSTLAIAYAYVSPEGPTVRLSYGTFQGSSAPDLDKFLGIPFAQAGRFELPKTPAHLSGIQQATSFGPACPQQLTIPPVPIPGLGAGPTNTSEDCLFVNIIKPSVIPHGAKLPVLFWIYGGGYGTGDTSLYDGSPVVTRSIALGEPVIYVSVNYRLNAFGFSGSKEIKAAGIGNLGLRDQRFALQWVQDNIAQFGGDKTKVTIWGESAGAISVGLHMVVNGGNQKGLFRGAFMESGSPVPMKDITTGQPFYDQLVADTGCHGSVDTLACLKTVPLGTFRAAVNNSSSLFSLNSLKLTWEPRVDGSFITENPQDSVVKGAFSKVPFVTGDCDDEGTIFSLAQSNLTTNQEATDYLHTNYFPAASKARFQVVADLYPSDPAQGSPFDTGTANQHSPEYKRLAAFQGDMEFQAPRRFFLQTASKRQDTWSFLIKRNKTASFLGAFHTSDLAEFYASKTVNDFQGTDALVNFANTGNPNNGAKNNISSLIFWPKYSTNSVAPPLLTFLDPNATLAITTDTFRKAPMEALIKLLREFSL